MVPHRTVLESDDPASHKALNPLPANYLRVNLSYMPISLAILHSNSGQSNNESQPVAMSTLSQPASHPSCLDDELTALMLQLEELGVYSNTGKGKHPVGRPPNIEIVYDQFQAELRDYKTFLDDQKLAQSIGAAVHTDGAIIEDVLSQNVQAHEDHRFAMELSNNDPEIETPPPFCDALHADIQDWRSSVPHGIAAASITEFSDDEIKAGPSMTYADRQADVLNKLSMQFQCYACTDRFPRASMVTTKCSHRYCIGCMKSLFMRSTRDEGLYPPRCCRQSIPLTLVANHMTEDELETFQLSAVEYATNDKTYCSNPECATFLPPATIDADTKRVACPKCGIETCAICKNTYNSGEDCPEDDALQQTRVLARAMGWQTCFGCNRVVILRSGCNHMT